MVHGNAHSVAVPAVSQVSLVHSSDSVRTLTSSNSTTPSTSTFSFAAPTTAAKMSKPPVRVVAPPPSASTFNSFGRPTVASIPTMSVQPMAGRTQDEYLSRSHTSSHSDERDVRLADALQRVRAVKRQVADEESELRRLRELERETTTLKQKNSSREEELEKETKALLEEQNALRSATMRVQGLARQLEELYRRRQTAAAAALVEHRKMQQQQQMSRSTDTVIPSASRTSVQEVIRPRASVEPFQVSHTKSTIENDIVKSIDYIDGDVVDTKIPSEPAYLAPSPKQLVEKTTREEASPSPPKDPHPTIPTAAFQRMGLDTKDGRSAFEPSANLNSSMTSEIVERPTSFGDSLDESKLRSGKTDLVSLRSDSLKATKRRSWAASEGTSMTEAETIHRLLEEQRKGRNHFIPQLPTPVEEPSTTSAVVMAEEKEVIVEKVEVVEEKSTDEETSSARSDDGTVEMEDVQSIRRVKGILRAPNVKMDKGRIEFDPLALLLDAALEGELDLVKTSASKLSDVSTANDEGITALHNAICAGHYEIVKFLIEHDADVNAQDSDGWTPLHCAASCNNLPMVRQLVEGGGCVLASTLSDMETPVEKCEEEEDGYDGCLRYLLAAHNATGTLNNSKVYAAYSYEAQFEDELSFAAGDELVVLSKDDVDKHWWTCRNEKSETGLVPRTYVALYPALKFRKKLNFVMFDLPLEANNNSKDD